MQEKNVNSLFFTTSSESGDLFAEVIIPLALPLTYTWSVPAHLQPSIKIGQRVEVQLRNKKYAGIVKKLHTEKPALFEPKELLNVLDDEPLVHEKQLQLWNWMSDYYMCSEGEVMQAAIPANLKLSSESILIWNEEADFDLNDGSLFSDEEYLVAQALEIKKELKLSGICLQLFLLNLSDKLFHGKVKKQMLLYQSRFHHKWYLHKMHNFLHGC